MITDLDRKIGLRIAARRRALGWSQAYLGTMAGIPFQQLSRYERGDNRVSASLAGKISECLGVRLEALLDGDAPARPKSTGGELEITRLFRTMDPRRQKAALIIVRAVAD